jgi:hypothetical protein
MTDMGRLRPFAIVSFRPETVIGRGLTECPLADQKDAMKPKDAAVRTTLLKPP